MRQLKISTKYKLSVNSREKFAWFLISDHLSARVIWHMLTDETEYSTQDKELTQRKRKAMECLADASD